MNNKRRKVLNGVLDELERLREPDMDKETALKILDDSHDITEESMDEEESVIDSLPENLRWSSRTMNMQDNYSDLMDAEIELTCAVEDCKTMTSYDYGKIRQYVQKAVHLINQAIIR